MNVQNKPSIFFDADGKRARFVSWAAWIVAAGFVAASSIYVSGLIVAPRLPSPSLEHQGVDERVGSNVGGVVERVAKPGYAARQRVVPRSAGAARRFAFAWVGDAAAAGQIRNYAGDLDGLILDILAIERDGARQRLVTNQYAPWFMRWIGRFAPHARVYALVGSEPGSGGLALATATGEGRSALTAQLVTRHRELGISGLVLDARAIPESGHIGFVRFLHELREGLMKSGGGSVIVIAGRELQPARLRQLSQPADHVLLHLFNEAVMGPPAAQAWFEEELRAKARLVDPRKLIVGVGALAQEWDDNGNSRRLSVQAAWDLAREQGAQIALDTVSLNPTFSFMTQDGRRRTVWMLDAVTAFNHVRAALAEGVGGVAVHRMGGEDPGVWGAIGRGRVPDRGALPGLEQPRPATDGFQRIGFDVLRAEPGQDGVRKLHMDDGLGLITAARFERLPYHARFSGLRAVNPRTVALTFDDGPDPLSTPRILDVLARKNVKATFYVIGANAARHPEIVRRIYAEGHDIGNHSYSHWDMARLGPQEIARELNGVQRLLEAQLGIRTILFRAPYAMASYREFVAAPALMSTVSELGYLVGGIDIESYDYVLGRSAEEIRRRVVRDTVNADRSVAVLMHDGGRNRNATVEALELIIDDLVARGFEFATTHAFVGLDRDAVMPRQVAAGPIEVASAQVRGQYMSALAQSGQVVGLVAIGAALLAILRLMVIIVLAHVQWRREVTRVGLDWRPDKIAVLVPGYNEEKVICKTVQSLLDSTIADRLEIIVIDDGSTDRTSEIVAETFAGLDSVRVFKKTNGGKSAALNYGLLQTDAEIVVAIDADTMLEPEAIALLVRHFGDPQLGAVAGNAVVGNQCNMLTRMQALEYVTSQNLERRALEIVNAIPVVPGAIGAWRRVALLEAGGYGHDTLAEDADVTIELERQGWKVIYEPRARALTEAPESLKAFLKQRFRWMFGTLQVAYKNLTSRRRMPWQIALITIPNVFVFSFAFTLLAPIVDAILLLTIVNSVAGLLGEGGGAYAETLGQIAFYWVLFQTVDVVVALLAIRMDSDRANFALLPWIVVQRFTYRQLLYWVAFRALLAAIKGQFVGWGKLLRTGSVSLPAAR